MWRTMVRAEDSKADWALSLAATENLRSLAMFTPQFWHIAAAAEPNGFTTHERKKIFRSVMDI